MENVQREVDAIYKVIIIGDSHVGKSQILRKYVKGPFVTETIGVDFRTKTVERNALSMKLHIWDTAGQERYRTMTTSYYRGCHGIILTFDRRNKASFYNLNDWLAQIEYYQKVMHVPVILVGNDLHHDPNLEDKDFVVSGYVDPSDYTVKEMAPICKIDKQGRPVTVTTDEATRFAQINDCSGFIETNSGSGSNIDTVFDRLLDEMMKGDGSIVPGPDKSIVKLIPESPQRTANSRDPMNYPSICTV